MSAVFAFECHIKGHEDWSRVINARSRGSAKVEYWRDVSDAWPSIPFTSVRARKVGAPQTSAQFMRNAEYRGLPSMKCGDRVKVGESRGVVVGHNESANIVVLFDDDAPRYAGMKLSVHPQEMSVETDREIT